MQMLLLDTNVWLDAFLPNRKRTAEAWALLNRAERKDVALLYPVHIVPDVFYLCNIGTKEALKQVCPDDDELRAAAARTSAWECVNRMRDIATAVGADVTDVWLACKQEALHNDVEDNLVIAAMQRSHADALVTSDKALAAHAPCTTFDIPAALRYLETLG